MEPFLDDMKRQIELGLEAEALEICKGVVLGLYRVEQGKSGELVERAPDFPAEAAASAIETWATGGGGRKRSGRSRGRIGRRVLPQDFVDQQVPDWSSMIARVLSRRR
ncbi:MAG: hypothetical protein HY652_00420 [Acidobacteria bacterium]|nr:hypothetical protein [Acidobacteriota bacterium]